MSAATTGPSLPSFAGDSSEDAVRLYFKEIGRVPLLNAEEEVGIGTRIRNGGAAAEELAERSVTKEKLNAKDRAHLERLVSDGDQARDELTRANLRLVVSIAKRYARHELPLLDLIQEGNLGLIRAVEKFDPSKGFKFSTYATWWIRQSITRAIADQGRTIRVPVHVAETVNRLKRVQWEMRQELMREPTVAELAAEVHETTDRVAEILRIARDTLSLDSPLAENEDLNLANFVEDEDSVTPSDAVNHVLLVEAVHEVLDDLPEREREVVRMRFGLDDGQPRTLKDVAAALGVTRERIRQIEIKTLSKLRHPQRSAQLRAYLEPR